MAEKRIIDLEVRDNTKDVQSKFDDLRKEISKTTNEIDELSNAYGENSQEVDKARKKLSELTQAYDTLSKSATDVGASFEQVYGELQPLTTRMGEAEDRLYELALAGKQGTKEYQDLLNTVSKYRKIQIDTDLVVDASATTMNQKLLGAVGGVASGFEIAEGAAALFGVEASKLQETMVRIQSVMAITQGIQGLKEAGSSFKSLGTAASNALKGIKTGLAATGIGLFVVALGTVVTYWDDIKAAVSGVSEEQSKLNALSHANFETAKDELSTLDAQDNVLKLQGKSERDILNIKIKKVTAAIETGKIELENVIKTSKAEEEAAIKNYNYTKKLVDLIIDSALFLPKLMLMPIDLAIKGANKVSEALGLGKVVSFDLGKTIEDLEDKASSFIAGSLFNVEEVKAEGEKTRKELQKEIQGLENQKAGFQLAINQIDKQAAIDAKKAREDAAKDAKDQEEKNQKDFEERMKNENRLRTKSVLEASNAAIEQKKHESQQEKEILDIRAKAYQDYLDKIKAKEEEEAARKKKNRDFAVEMALSGLSTISNLTELFGKKNEKAAKKAFQVNKAAQIAMATIETYKSAVSAYASQLIPGDPTSPVRGAIAAGVAVAAGLVNIAKIASQKFEGGGSAGGGGTPSAGGGGEAGGAVAPNFNVIGSSGVNQLAQIQQQPTRAYVVSGDVANGLSLERNRLQNATL